MINYYSPEGEPIDLDNWMKRFEDRNSKIIGKDTIGDSDVSTVYLGLNHAWTPEVAPLIFETMIFGGEYDQWQCRWSTKERAIQGHKATIAWLLHEGPEPEGCYSRTYDEWFLEKHGVHPTA